VHRHRHGRSSRLRGRGVSAAAARGSRARPQLRAYCIRKKADDILGECPGTGWHCQILGMPI
jgi:hypothetical protein